MENSRENSKTVSFFITKQLFASGASLAPAPLTRVRRIRRRPTRSRTGPKRNPTVNRRRRTKSLCANTQRYRCQRYRNFPHKKQSIYYYSYFLQSSSFYALDCLGPTVPFSRVFALPSNRPLVSLISRKGKGMFSVKTVIIFSSQHWTPTPSSVAYSP